MGFTLNIDISDCDAEPETALRKYYDLKRNRVQNCCPPETHDHFIRIINNSEEVDLDHLDDNPMVFETVPSSLLSFIDWLGFHSGTDWRHEFDGDELDELICFFEGEAEQLGELEEGVEDGEFPWDCVLRAGPLHLCHFAKERDLTVEYLD